MENQTNFGKVILQRALYIYISVCVLLVMIILFNAFDQRGGNTLQGELYLKPNITLNGVKTP
jgi:hypothetical protein